MKIHATFIGKDGSLGYQKGLRYTLFLSWDNCVIHIEEPNPENTKPCIYSNIGNFLQNWENISRLKP